MLDGVLKLHSEGAAAGKFRLLEVGNTFHVIPTRVRNKAGHWIEQTSVLDAPVTIVNAQRTVREMVVEICKEVAIANNVKVAHMDPYIGSFLTKTADFSAYNEPARDALIRALAVTGDRMGWKLLYIPNEGWTGYVLTLSQLPRPEVSKKPLTRSKAPVRSDPRMPGVPQTEDSKQR
jgi:hypothetical protein